MSILATLRRYFFGDPERTRKQQQEREQWRQELKDSYAEENRILSRGGIVVYNATAEDHLPIILVMSRRSAAWQALLRGEDAVLEGAALAQSLRDREAKQQEVVQ